MNFDKVIEREKEGAWSDWWIIKCATLCVITYNAT